MEDLRRLKILMSAFACEPEEGSEPEVGWRWAVMMSRDNDVVVVTQEKNRKHIEPFLEKHPDICENVTFVFHEHLAGLRRLKRRFGWLMLPYYTLWQWSLRGVVDKLVKEHEIDLIHHTTFASFRMPVFLRGRPVVWGPVGGADTAPSHLLGFHGPWQSVWRERVRNWMTEISKKILFWVDPSVETGGFVFASTPETADAFSNQNIPVELLPTVGMEVAESSCNVFSEGDEPVRLLFVGRLHHLKGLQFLFEALKNFGVDEVKLTLVGTGPQEGHLKRLAVEMGLEGLVDFVGFVPRPKLAEIYERHDLLVAPSLYESGGLSILEAFSHGLPAIALKRGGPAMMVGPECGTLIEVDQPLEEVCGDLKEAIKGYVSDRGQLLEKGKAAKEVVIERYSWDEKRRKMQAAYDSVVDL